MLYMAWPRQIIVLRHGLVRIKRTKMCNKCDNKPRFVQSEFVVLRIASLLSLKKFLTSHVLR